MGASFSFDQFILLVSHECQLYGLNKLCDYLYCYYPIKAPLNFIKLVLSKEFDTPFDPIVSKGVLQEYRRTFKLQTFINSWVFMFLMTTDIISTVLVLTFLVAYW